MEDVRAAMWAGNLTTGTTMLTTFVTEALGVRSRRIGPQALTAERLTRALLATTSASTRSGARRACHLDEQQTASASSGTGEKDALERDRRALEFEGHHEIARDRVRSAAAGALATHVGP